MQPTRTVYETLEQGSALDMVPSIRNILGGFLFSGDDIQKMVGVLSGGERTRLAVARMLLRSSNTLLLDEPTNHLDLDSKDVLLEAIEDYGGTLILVSHDRYFVEKLATKIIEVGHGDAIVYPGTYSEFLWSKERANQASGSGLQAPGRDKAPSPKPKAPKPGTPEVRSPQPEAPPTSAKASELSRDQRKQLDANRKKRQRTADTLNKRIAELEGRIADRESKVKELEAAIAAPGFYDDPDAAKAVIDRHQALMWEVGDLMGQWEALQEHAAENDRAPLES
jgi:ATP-binding cassette subfamily F protein 3